MRKVRDFMLVKEAAKYLGVSPNTVRKWGNEGKIATYRNPMNGYRLFRRSDLEQLLRKINRPGRL